MPPRPLLALVALALAGCTHLPWKPYSGWRAWRTPNISLYTDTISQYEPALDWLDSAYSVYKGTFFGDFNIPSVEVLYVSSDSTTPFLDSSGKTKYGMTVARSPWAEARGGKTLVVVGYSEWQWHYHHQIAHHFIEAAVPGAPLWFHEGFARYLTSVYGVPGRPGVVCFGKIQPVTTTQVTLPLQELLAASYQEYNETKEPWLGPLSQSFVDFLIHGQEGRLRPRLSTLMRELGKGKSSEQALAEVYPELPLAQMDVLFRSHVRTVRPPGQECPLPLEIRSAMAKNQPIRGPVSEADVRELLLGLEHLPSKNGYADFIPDPGKPAQR